MLTANDQFASKTSCIARWTAWLRRHWNHPAMALPALVVVTQIVGECYPLSNFPMYSNPSPQPSDYIYVTDRSHLDATARHIPVSMEGVFGVRSAKSKKILISRLEDFAKQHDTKRELLTAEQIAVVGAIHLSELRKRGETIGNTELIPGKLGLVRGIIHAELGVALHREERLIATEP